VNEEGNLVVKFFCLKRIMTLFKYKKFSQISVPAAAVIQEELAVFIVIERKRYVGGFLLMLLKFKLNHLKHVTL